MADSEIPNWCRPVKDKVVTQGQHHSFEVDEDCGIKLTLGNLSDAGWFWDGDESSILGFFVRMGSMRVKDEKDRAFKEMDKLNYHSLKSVFFDALKEKDGLYELSGDNALWHFGSGGDGEQEGVEAYLDEKVDEYMLNPIIDEYWMRKDASKQSFENFKKEFGEQWVEDAKDCINTKNKISGLAMCLSGLGYSTEGILFEETPDHEALDEATKKIKEQFSKIHVYDYKKAHPDQTTLTGAPFMPKNRFTAVLTDKEVQEGNFICFSGTEDEIHEFTCTEKNLGEKIDFGELPKRLQEKIIKEAF